MNNLLGLLLGSLTQQSSVNAASKKSGLSAKTILTIISYALPLILKAMNKNASNTSGAQSLLSALEPLLNPVWVLLFDGEKPGPMALIGGAVVIAAVTLWTVYGHLHPAKAEA